MTNGKIILLIAVVAIVFIIILVEKPNNKSETDNDIGMLGLVDKTQGSLTPKEGELAPDFRLETLDGNIVSLSDFKGQPVFLNFWATWCPFCIDEMPDMQKVFEEYKNQGLVILGVNRAEDTGNIKQFLEEELYGEITYLILLDKQDELAKQYIPFGMPVSYFIDKNGVVVDMKFGQLLPEEIEEKVNKIL